MPLTLMKGLVAHFYFKVLWRESERELCASFLGRLELWRDEHGGLKDSFPLVLTYVPPLNDFPPWLQASIRKRIEVGMKENVTRRETEWRFRGDTLSGNVAEGHIDLLPLSSTRWLTLYRSSVSHYWNHRWRQCLTDGSHENLVY